MVLEVPQGAEQVRVHDCEYGGLVPMTGTMVLPKMDGYEVKPGVTLIGEPTPVPGTDKLRCLANAFGALCVVELSIKFPVEVP